MYDLASCGILTVALSCAVLIGAQQWSSAAITVIAVASASSLAIGRATLQLPIAAFRLLAEYLLGFLVVSILVFVVCWIGTLSAGVSAMLVAAAGLTAGGFCLMFGREESSGRPADLLMLMLICLASLVWSWQAIVAVPRLVETGVFRAWSDYFIHSAEVAQFANFRALSGTSIFAGGAPLPLYHYGSYMISAALCGISGIPAITVATAFWTPLGFVLLGLGACVLGSVLGGRAAGVFAATFVLLVPDAAHYGLKNPFFDFHWLLQISSSGSYAVAFSCFALAALIAWLRTRDRSSFWWGAATTIMVFEFRVHVFVLLMLIYIAIILFAWHPPRGWHKLAATALTAGSMLVGAAMSEYIARSPHFLTGTRHPVQALLLLLGMQPSPYAELYARTVNSLPAGARIATGLSLLIFAAFGVFFPLYVIGLIWRIRSSGLATEDWIPLVAVVSYCGIVVVFPDTPLEPLEFAHRPFVLCYVMLAVWCARFTTAAFADRLSPSWNIGLTSSAAAFLLAVPLVLERTAQSSHLSWGVQMSVIPIPKGLLEAAQFIRRHAAPGDLVATSEGPLDEPFLALSERREFFPGTEFLLIQSAIPPESANSRRADLGKILKASMTDKPRGAAERLGVDWVVTFPPALPPRRLLGEAALDAGGFVVQCVNVKTRCKPRL